MEEIELKDLFYMVWNKLWLIILLAVVFAVGSYYYTVNYITPQYQTSTTVMLGKPAEYTNLGYSYQEVIVNKQLIGTYAEIAKSKIVMDEMREALGAQINTDILASRISVNLVGDTEIIRISVTDASPVIAMHVANAAADAFMNNVSRIMKIDNVTVIDQAEEPSYPISPSVTRNVGIAGVLGVMLALFIVFLIQMFDNTIKIPEDVQRHLDLNVIGMIPKHD